MRGNPEPGLKNYWGKGNRGLDLLAGSITMKSCLLRFHFWTRDHFGLYLRISRETSFWLVGFSNADQFDRNGNRWLSIRIQAIIAFGAYGINKAYHQAQYDERLYLSVIRALITPFRVVINQLESWRI